MGDVTVILDAIEAGDSGAASRLMTHVYSELRQLARAKLATERPGQTLDATALVHEAYLRLVGAENIDSFDNRRHFFAAAAEAMRRILVDRARRRKSVKHGGAKHRVELTDCAASMPDEDLLALDEALTRLTQQDALAGKVVELRHFAGMNHDQVAATLGITVYQARQKWTYARAWLRNALGG